ncbi:LysR substrate-binding domain-containing protein [Streptosporangium sandarakinum]|uniref:LysR substrate-binding domain-containing protein n=1 Tax=Streptosporangium sandarakinum TaxID=1260955 RepID=UPI00368C3631
MIRPGSSSRPAAAAESWIAASTTDYFFAQTLVAAGVGVALIPEVALHLFPGLVVVPVEPSRPTRYVGMAVTDRRRARPHVAGIADALLAAAGAAGPRRGNPGGDPPGGS